MGNYTLNLKVYDPSNLWANINTFVSVIKGIEPKPYSTPTTYQEAASAQDSLQSMKAELGRIMEQLLLIMNQLGQ